MQYMRCQVEYESLLDHNRDPDLKPEALHEYVEQFVSRTMRVDADRC